MSNSWRDAAAASPDLDAAALEAIGAVLDGTRLIVPDRSPAAVSSAVASLGWTVRLFLADRMERELRPLDDGSAAADAAPLPIDGTSAGRCYRRLLPIWSSEPEPHLWVPLLDGVERLGVARYGIPGGEPDARTMDVVRWFTHMAAHLLASKSAYADVFELVRRNQQRTVASELVWSLLPPLTVACHGVVIAGSLEPADAVAGDVFDYAIDEHVAHVAIADATGHDLSSSIIGSVAVAAYRVGRRRGSGLIDTVCEIDAALAAVAPYTFATGVFAELDVRSGRFTYVNAGHPSPLLLRRGRVVKQLDGARRIILGISPPAFEVAQEQLEPGDWVLLYTDGVTEARDDQGTFFGIERLVDTLERCAADGSPAPETLRRATHGVLDHQAGVLQDDASMVVVQWATEAEQDLRTA